MHLRPAPGEAQLPLQATADTQGPPAAPSSCRKGVPLLCRPVTLPNASGSGWLPCSRELRINAFAESFGWFFVTSTRFGSSSSQMQAMHPSLPRSYLSGTAFRPVG